MAVARPAPASALPKWRRRAIRRRWRRRSTGARSPIRSSLPCSIRPSPARGRRSMRSPAKCSAACTTARPGSAVRAQRDARPHAAEFVCRHSRRSWRARLRRSCIGLRGGRYQFSGQCLTYPTKAAPGARGPSRDLTFWAQGLGGWGHSDSDGNAASLKSRSAASSRVSMRASVTRGAPASWPAICAPISMSMRVRAAPASTACSSAATRAAASARSMCAAGVLFARQHRYQPRHYLPRLYRQGECALPRQCRTGVRRGRLRHGLRSGRGGAARRAGLRARARWFVPRERRRCGAVGFKCE